MKHAQLCLLVSFALAVVPARGSDLAVAFTVPELKSGMASLETMLQIEAEGFLDDVLALVEEVVDKPLFMKAFTGAAVTSSLLSGHLEARDRVAFSVGSTAALWTSDWSPATLEQLDAISTDDDLEIGAGVQPLLAQAAISLGRFVPGLDAGVYAGFMDVQGSGFGLRSFSAGLFSGLTLFAPATEARPGMLGWQGLRLSLGGGYSSGTLSMLVEPGPIYQTIPVDPDGAGPLVALSTTLQVDPSVMAGVKSSVYGVRFVASTGLSLFRAINLALGAGGSLSAGSSSVSLESADEVVVLGYLSSLVETDGAITISGSTAAVSAVLLSPILTAGIGFRVGAFELSIPVVWNVPAGLGFAVLAEMRP
jgi:hypothetical protein